MISKKGYYFSTLKTKTSNRYVLIDDFLIGELRRWKDENENVAGGSYVHIYEDADHKIIQQSKSLRKFDAEKFFLVYIRVDGHI